MNQVPQQQVYGKLNDDTFDSSDSDDAETIYPLEGEGGTSSLDGDDVWLETPHPDGFGEMVLGEGGAVEDFDTFLPEDTDMIAMLTTLDGSNPGDGGGMGAPSLSTTSGGSGSASGSGIKAPQKIKWVAGTPDYVSRGASAAAAKQLLLESKGSGLKSGSSRGSVREYPFFIPVLAYTEMYGSVEEEYARTLRELQRRQYMARRRSQSFNTFRLSTSIQKLPPALFRVVMKSANAANKEPLPSSNDIQEGFYTMWELRTTKIHPTFQSFKAPPFNAECKLFADEEYRPLITHAAPYRSPTSDPFPMQNTLLVDGGVCVKSWVTLASSPHWGAKQVPFQTMAPVGCLHAKSEKDHSLRLSGNRSLFPGVAGTSHHDSAPSSFTLISLPIPSKRAGDKEPEKDDDNEDVEVRDDVPAHVAPRGSMLASVYKQRRPLRGWKGEDAEAGANGAVQHRSFPRDVRNTLSVGFMRPTSDSIPIIPSWIIKTEAKPEYDPSTIKQESAEGDEGQGVSLVHLTSALSKVAKLIGTNATLQAALLELSAASLTSSPNCNIEGL